MHRGRLIQAAKEIGQDDDESGTQIEQKQKSKFIHIVAQVFRIKNRLVVVHDTFLARGIRNLIFVREIGHSLPLDFETLPSFNNIFVFLSKDLARISYTAIDLVLRSFVVVGNSCKSS